MSIKQGLIDIEFNKRDLRRLERRLRGIKGGVPRVMNRALNDTAKSARAHAAKEISADTAMKQKDIKRYLILSRATRRRWIATLAISRKRIPLIRFGARQTKKGVSYKVRAAQGRQTIPHAFVQTVGAGGHKGVFVRKSRGDERVARLPIRELRGPSLGHVVTNAGRIVGRLHREASVNLRKKIEQQVTRLVRQAG